MSPDPEDSRDQRADPDLLDHLDLEDLLVWMDLPETWDLKDLLDPRERTA